MLLIVIVAFMAYENAKKIEWDKPRIKVAQKQPFLPLEEEVQQLVNGCGKITGTYSVFEFHSRQSYAANFYFLHSYGLHPLSIPLPNAQNYFNQGVNDNASK